MNKHGFRLMKRGGPLSAVASRMSSAHRSPLLHFAVIGGLLLALAPAPDDSDVTVERATLEALFDAQARKLDLPYLTGSQEREIVAQLIEDEILYREALRLHLDRNDQVVRQRLILKTAFLAEDLGGASRPVTEDELKRFFAQDPTRWREPKMIRFSHVLVPAERREELTAIRSQLQSPEPGADDATTATGDSFPLLREMTLTPVPAIANVYGRSFLRILQEQDPGVWGEPAKSKFGWHLVRVNETRDAQPRPFEQVRAQVELAYLQHRKRRAVSAFVDQASARYRVAIQDADTAAPYTGGASSSAEDL